MRGLIYLSIVVAATVPLLGQEKATTAEDAGDSTQKTMIEGLKTNRRAEVAQLVTQLDKIKAAIKKATVVDDQKLIPELKKSLETAQASLRDLVAAPLTSGTLNPKRISKGLTGTFLPKFKVLQVLDKSSTGEALIVPKAASLDVLFKVTGLDTTNLVDGSELPRNLCYAVTGTYSYTALSGATKTIFELSILKNESVYNAEELKALKEIWSEPYSVKLTEEEAAKLKEIQESRQAAADQQKKEKDAEESAKQARAKAREAQAKAKRAQSYLDFGKAHLKKNNTSGARKEFEKAIAESPESDAGKEAKKLLDGLP